MKEIGAYKSQRSSTRKAEGKRPIIFPSERTCDAERRDSLAKRHALLELDNAGAGDTL